MKQIGEKITKFIGKVFNIISVTMFNENIEKECTYEYMESPEVIHVLPYIVTENEFDRMVLIKEYRVGANKKMIGFPAGKVDPGETPEEAAIREVREEVGLETIKLIPLCSGYSSPGVSTEFCHFYIAICRKATQKEMEDVEMDSNEDIEIINYSLSNKFEDEEELMSLLKDSVKSSFLFLKYLQMKNTEFFEDLMSRVWREM